MIKNFRTSVTLSLCIGSIKELFANAPNTAHYKKVKDSYLTALKPLLENLEKCKLHNKENFYKVEKAKLENLKNVIQGIITLLNSKKDQREKVLVYNDLIFNNLTQLNKLANELI